MLVNFFSSLLIVARQWIKRIAALPFHVIAAFFRFVLSLALTITGFVGSIVRPATRFLAYLLFVIAAVSLVADLTPALAGVGPFETTTLADHWRSIARLSLQRAEAAAQNMHWTVPVVLQTLLNSPAFIVLGLAGLACALVGQRRTRINVFAN